MLTSFISRSTKQSTVCKCQWRLVQNKTITAILLEDYLYSKKCQRLLTTNARKHQQQQSRNLSRIPRTQLRAISTETDSKVENILKHRNNTEEVLSFALDQSKVPIAESLVENTFSLLRKNKTEAAWECYLDLSQHRLQSFLSADQYKRLIKLFNHKSSQEKGLQYVLTLIEDMKSLGYNIGRKEKVLLMRLLSINGNLQIMEQIFESLKSENHLASQDLTQAQKPFHIVLQAYHDHVRKIGSLEAAKKSMSIYEEMIEYKLHPTESATKLLMQNLRYAKVVDIMLDDIWAWTWKRIEMNNIEVPPQLDPRFFREMIIYFSSAGRADLALQIYDRMIDINIPPTLRTMTALIHKVGRSGNMERSMELFNDMVVKYNITPNLITFNALIDIHAHRKPQPDIDGAERMYQSIVDLQLKPNDITYSILFDMYAKEADVKNARRIFNEMVRVHRIKPTPYIYSSCIELFMACNDYDSAYKVLGLLKKVADRRAPSARVVYNLMFKQLVEHDCIKEALQLLEVMIKERMSLETKTFKPMLSHFARRGDVAGTHKVASMMTQANCRPNRFTFYSLLQSFARAGDVSGAEEMFEVYKSRYPLNTSIYNAMLYVYTKRSEMDKVLNIYKRMTKASISPNEFTYGILMNFYTKRKELDAVVSLLDTMHTNNVEPTVGIWTILMDAYFLCGQPHEGRQIIEQMMKAGVQPSSISWAVLIKGCATSNMLDVAQAILDEKIDTYKRQYAMQQKSLLRDKEIHDSETYTKEIPETLEDLLYAKNDFSAKYMLSPYLFTPVINAHCTLGNYQEAKKLFHTMRDLSVEISIPTYTLLMKIFKETEQYDAVEKLWRGLYQPEKDQTAIFDIDPLIPSVPLPKTTYNYLNLLSLDADLESVEVVPNRVTPFALSIYLDTLMAQSRFSDIDTLWDELSQDAYGFDEHNWNRYISALLLEGKLKKACSVIPKQFLQASLKSERADNSNVEIEKITRNSSFMTSDVQLHAKTCKLFADAFDIRGVEYTPTPRLRATIIRRINDFLAQQKKTLV
ncbi:hypothetical protein BDF20DRAFT_987589 [Mycotypha africana]|uniref:uncharacterized protein n=1 Tax=Mycotypha africana TaxID=64632 RepID=UPI002301372B|nr:uncharacterized protein BDF20DRAFT_987589 [Mycotypha africana]KAI8979298.1 hypothetical protein BDF20DRAFT_987589 [Mycotypha africana]